MERQARDSDKNSGPYNLLCSSFLLQKSTPVTRRQDTPYFLRCRSENYKIGNEPKSFLALEFTPEAFQRNCLLNRAQHTAPGHVGAAGGLSAWDEKGTIVSLQVRYPS